MAAVRLESIVANINQTAIKQNEYLKKVYDISKFMGIPIHGSIVCTTESNCYYTKFSPNSFKFYTYQPHLIKSVDCWPIVGCQVAEAVSTVQSYTSSESRNWGVKISSKFSLFEKLFEVGGEVSAGKTYTCAYTKSGTTTTNVECSILPGERKTLQLYEVKSDLECQISKSRWILDTRNGKSSDTSTIDFDRSDILNLVFANHISPIQHENGIFLLNPDNFYASESLLYKIKKAFPDYNPYTDLIKPHINSTRVIYFKEDFVAPGYKKIIPFSNENGDSIFMHACVAI